MVNGSTSPSIRLGGFIAIKLVMIELCLKDPNFCCFSTKLHFCDKLTKVFSPIFFNEKFRVEQRNERFHFRNTGWFCIESSENNCYSVRHLPRLHLRLLRICLGFFLGGRGGGGEQEKTSLSLGEGYQISNKYGRSCSPRFNFSDVYFPYPK